MKSVLSSKSNKTIESLAKQVKTLKKSVSVLQAHNEGMLGFVRLRSISQVAMYDIASSDVRYRK